MNNNLSVHHHIDDKLDNENNIDNLSNIGQVTNLNFNNVNKALIRKRRPSKHPLRQLRIQANYTLDELAQVANLSPSYLSRLENGTRRLNEDILQRLSIALSCSPNELLPYTVNNNVTSISNHKKNERNNYSVDLPVYRLLGDSNSNSGSIDATLAQEWIPRIPELSGVANAFSCCVESSCWSPRYMDGDKILVHPTLPLKQNCSVIVISNEGKVYLGRLLDIDMSNNSQDITIELFNNTVEKNITLKQSDIKYSYKIIGVLEAS